MTTYEKELLTIVEQRYSQLSHRELIEQLLQMGVVDYSRCKILSVRSFVNERLGDGMKKLDAMACAAERFGCSYEYIRKCIYYYKEVNIC